MIETVNFGTYPQINLTLEHSKWFECRRINSFVRVRVVLTRTVDIRDDSEMATKVPSAQVVKRQSPTTVLFGSTLTRTITQGELNYCYTTLPDFCDSLAVSALTPCNTA